MIIRYLLLGPLSLLLLLAPAVAQAKWLEASSENFVIYADGREKDVRRLSELLERYHATLEMLTSVDLVPPSPSNRVTVYVVKNKRQVKRLFGEGSRFIGGFYIPRAGSSLTIIPRTGRMYDAPSVLLHEYGHHFARSNSNLPTPRWYSEGFAEFVAASEFPKDGTVSLGLPANQRYYELYRARDISAEALLDPEVYKRVSRAKIYDNFYGKSWLLYHMLVFDEERRGQMGVYLTALSQGNGEREAAEIAFGDLKELDRDLDRYMRKRSLMGLIWDPEELASGEIIIRELREGEAEMLPVQIRSRRGVDRETAIEVLADAREVAAEYPGDPAVQTALAEAEYDAGNDAQAIAAADAALAGDPGLVNAYVQKGYALFRQAADAEDQQAAYTAALVPFLALNKLEPDHPLPLIYYYRSFLAQGKPADERAVQGLQRAAELAPFDLSLRTNLARQYLIDGNPQMARGHLLPVAYNPHGGRNAAAMQIVIERIDDGSLKTHQDFVSVMAAAMASVPEEAVPEEDEWLGSSAATEDDA